MAAVKLPDLDTASAIALSALAFLAEDPERLGQFMVTTGVEVDTLKSQLVSTQFQASVLDYLAGDESLLLTFTANARLDPQVIAPALHVLQSS